MGHRHTYEHQMTPVQGDVEISGLINTYNLKEIEGYNEKCIAVKFYAH